MKYCTTLIASVLALGIYSSLSAETVPKEATAIPNGSFPAVDFGKVKPGDFLTLAVKSPSCYSITTGTPSGGGDSLWQGSVSSFNATITGDYRGLHTGHFSGGMNYTCAAAGNGGGAISWAGDAKAEVPEIKFSI